METSSMTVKKSKKSMMKSFSKNKTRSKNTKNPQNLHIKDDKYSSKMIQNGPNINIHKYSYFIDGFLYI